MHQCINCGATLKAGQNRCDVCGAETPYHKTQRVCMNCGAPAAQNVKICMMCEQPIDALPRRASSFSASWLGILIGLAVVGGIVYGFLQLEAPQALGSASSSPPATATPFFIPPTDTPTPTVTPTLPPTPTLSPTPTPTPKPLIHSIKTGETLNFIARKYNVSLEDIEQANNITQDTILQVGQELVIPFATDIDTNGENSREHPIILYTVKSGDTLSGIAFEYDTSVSAIEVANPGLDLDILSVGQEVLVPLRPPTFTPTPTITPTPTFTPRPPFLTPVLLHPQDDALIEGDTSSVLLNWTSSGTLDEDTYYVIYLSDNAGRFKTFPTRATSYRLPPELRPSQLSTCSWYVVVMKKIGIDAEDIFYGKALSNPSQTRTFRWR
ncbi:MAG TPA: LysM peptidoglycan-binding domain-containing protein [Chloroflexi bacterium]|nr:LysM peptidoglycan-binding domain-containing protein [Chloroflexota bacterium]